MNTTRCCHLSPRRITRARQPFELKATIRLDSVLLRATNDKLFSYAQSVLPTRLDVLLCEARSGQQLAIDFDRMSGCRNQGISGLSKTLWRGVQPTAQNEVNPRRFIGVVCPAVDCSSLDANISFFHVDSHAVVEMAVSESQRSASPKTQRCFRRDTGDHSPGDFAFEEDAKIQRFCPVKHLEVVSLVAGLGKCEQLTVSVLAAMSTTRRTMPLSLARSLVRLRMGSTHLSRFAGNS